LRHLLIPYEKIEKKICFLSYDEEYRNARTFIETEITKPDAKQTRRFDSSRGGLWLLT
jgi:hypothetical protein